MKGLHPDIGNYWGRATTSAETAYQQYLKDLSYTRVRILPTEVLARTSIEERIESRLKMMLHNIIPPIVIRQCDDRDDVTCAQILYRTMVFAGPASKEDHMKMMETLTTPKIVEVGKLYDAMIRFRFSRSRMKKYGFREPEPSQLFETLRVAATGLLEKDPQLHFQFNHFLMKHSSVNGLVSEETARQMYDMIIENARRFLDLPSGPDARAVQKGKDRRKGHDQMAGKGANEYACHYCGSTDHWIKHCPARIKDDNQMKLAGGRNQPARAQAERSAAKGENRRKR